jgi:hypothetical protein
MKLALTDLVNKQSGDRTWPILDTQIPDFLSDEFFR